MARLSVCGKIAFVTVTARQLSSAAIPYAAPSVSRDVALADVAVVVGMAVLYLGLEFLQVPKRWTFLAAGLALSGYLAYFTVRRPHSWHDLGFRRDNIATSLIPV